MVIVRVPICSVEPAPDNGGASLAACFVEIYSLHASSSIVPGITLVEFCSGQTSFITDESKDLF